MPMTLTVCHDAGGAEVIAAWCKAHPEEGPFLHVATGPAVERFAKRGLETVAPDFGLLDGRISRVIAAPGWNSLTEFEFIRVARKHGIRTIVYLDHWVNYRLRFGHPREGWEQNLPDEFWVGDDVAFSIAQKEFSGMPVTLVPNEYMREVARTFADIQSKIKEESDLVLFLSEPLSVPTTIFGDFEDVSFDEYQILEGLIGRLRDTKYRLLVRLHPSESKDKYAKFGVRISDEPELLADIARARVVVGMSTVALAHAAACGKAVWSVWPDLDRNIPPLPVPGIRTVSRAEEIALP
ncbi:hypothetical protein EDM68_05370 [Candidatus Uhrbacteria bacterium]|nr:MAG: hypothetical protein EDM68_05370 [Candidatus Uhrbacteria bacterium]